MKLVETAALTKGSSATEMSAAAQATVAASVAKARSEFAATAGKEFAQAVDLQRLQRSVNTVKSANVRTLYSACGTIHLYAPSSNQVDRLN